VINYLKWLWDKIIFLINWYSLYILKKGYGTKLGRDKLNTHRGLGSDQIKTST
jgi:hypothetical protein